jgi:TonB family protein
MQRNFNKKQIIGSLLLIFGSTLAAAAQSSLENNGASVSSFRLPQLVEGGGDAAIVRAIQLGVKYPRQALRDEAQGQSLVSFAVAPSGQVCLVKMEYGIRPDLDTAVVQAVRQLPRLQPAMQHGRPVACLMRAPVSFLIDNPSRLPRKPLPAADSTQLYPAVMRMPIYQGKLGYNKLAADLAAEYLRLGQASGCSLPKFGAQVLLTVGPSGALYNLQIVRADENQKAALAINFGEQIAKNESVDEMLEDEFPTACLPQLAEAVRHIPHLTPAYIAGQPVATRLLLTLPNPNRPH